MRINEVPFMFGSKVRSLREQRGWTQERLADRLSEVLGTRVDPLTVGRSEAAVRPVSLSDAMAFAAALDTTLDDLLAGTTDVAFTQQVAEQMEAGRLVLRLVTAMEEADEALRDLGQLLQRRPSTRASVVNHPLLAAAESMERLWAVVAGLRKEDGDGGEKQGEVPFG